MMTYRFYARTRRATLEINNSIGQRLIWIQSPGGFFVELAPMLHYQIAKLGILDTSPYYPFGDN